MSSTEHQSPRIFLRILEFLVLIGTCLYMQGGRTSDAEHYGNNYPDKVVKGLAITQVVVAGLSVVSQVKSRCPFLLLLLSMNVNLEVLLYCHL